MKFDSTGYTPASEKVQPARQQSSFDSLSLVRSLGFALNHSARKTEEKTEARVRVVAERMRY